MLDSLLSLNLITIFLVVSFATVIGINIIARLVVMLLGAYIKAKKL